MHTDTYRWQVAILLALIIQIYNYFEIILRGSYSNKMPIHGLWCVT